MKILFDTNVILDVLFDREPFSEVSTKLVSKVEKKEIKGFIGATTATTIHYLATKAANKKKADIQISKILDIFEVASISKKTLVNALSSQIKDFEDAVLHEAAKEANLQGIVTRNQKDFKKATISIYGPDELYSMIKSLHPPKTKS